MQSRVIARPVSDKEALTSLLLDCAAVVLALSSAFTVSFIGTLRVSDLLAMLYFIPAVLSKTARLTSTKYGKRLLALMAIWLVGELFADFYHHSEALDIAKGAAAISVFAIELISLNWLISTSERRFKLLAVAQAISVLIRGYISPGHQLIPGGTLVTDWKFGYGDVVTAIVLIALCGSYRKRNYIIVSVAFILLGIVHLSFNARSLALIVFISGALTLPLFQGGDKANGHAFRRSPRVNNSALQKALLIIVVLAAGEATNLLYSYAARNGYLGRDAADKFEEQSRGRYGVFLGGRPEYLIDGLVIMDSPIIGHGSYAKDARYVRLLEDDLVEAGYNERDARETEDSSDQIPAHSHILQAWIWAGLPGLAFWAYVLYLMGTAMSRLVGARLVLAPYLIYIVVGMFWDVLFSPFGLDRRFVCAFLIVAATSVLKQTDLAAAKLRSSGRPVGRFALSAKSRAVKIKRPLARL